MQYSNKISQEYQHAVDTANSIVEGFVTMSSIGWVAGLFGLFLAQSLPPIWWWSMVGCYLWGTILLIGYIRIVREQPLLLPSRWLWSLTLVYNLIIGSTSLILLWPTSFMLIGGMIAIWTGIAAIGAIRMLWYHRSPHLGIIL